MQALAKWQDLSNYFKAQRGEGVSYHTIQSWQALGMPYIRQSGHRVFFNLEECWKWYLGHFRVAA